MATYSESRTHNQKRQQSEAELSQDDSLTSKRFKSTREHRSSELPPTAFWDGLSKIWLTRSALKELGRRNAQSTSNHSCGQSKVKRPLTRSAVRDSKRRAQSLVPVPDYLSKAHQADVARLKAFARHGGPHLTDLRGYKEPRQSMSSSLSSLKRRRSTYPSSTTTKSKKSTTAYNRNFEQNLIDHGIYLDNRAQKPENWEEIKNRLAVPRPSLSPSNLSEEAFEAFQTSDSQAKDEDDVMIDLIPIISGVNNDFSARKTILRNLKPLTDGTIVPPNPDLYYGARPEQLNRQTRQELAGYIVPSKTENKPMAPNFYFEAKGPDGAPSVAKRQACYDGAVGARGLQMLQSYREDEPIYDNNAYTITSTYQSGNLKMYTTHPTQSDSRDTPEYHMTQISGWDLTGNSETFRQGTRAFRNAIDWTKEKRDQIISGANNRAQYKTAEPSAQESSYYNDPSDAYPTENSETSANEHAATSFACMIKDSYYDDYLDVTDVQYEEELKRSADEPPVEEYETSADELALISYKAPLKIQVRKAPR